MKPRQASRAYPGVDIVALYEKQNGSETAGRRMDSDQRAKYIAETKQRLGLNERMLGLSSKRSVHDGHLRYDIPHLEFEGYFDRLHGVHVFKPHEMQWSLDQFMERMIDTKEEADRRVEKIINSRYEETSTFFKRAEAYKDSKQEAEQTEAIKQQLKALSSEPEDKNKIF